MWGHYVEQNIRTGPTKVLPTRHANSDSFRFRLLLNVQMSRNTCWENHPVNNCVLFNKDSTCSKRIRHIRQRFSTDLTYSIQIWKIRQIFDISDKDASHSTKFWHILQRFEEYSTDSKTIRQLFEKHDPHDIVLSMFPLQLWLQLGETVGGLN